MTNQLIRYIHLTNQLIRYLLSASARTMFGLLPPSSKVVLFRLLFAAICGINCPICDKALQISYQRQQRTVWAAFRWMMQMLIKLIIQRCHGTPNNYKSPQSLCSRCQFSVQDCEKLEKWFVLKSVNPRWTKRYMNNHNNKVLDNQLNNMQQKYAEKSTG